MINKKIKDSVVDGNIVVIHHTNEECTKRIGKPYLAVVLCANSSRGPLILELEALKKGKYYAHLTTWENITRVVGLINLASIMSESLSNSSYFYKISYDSAFNLKWQRCMYVKNFNKNDATLYFDETANVDDVVGFYLKFHGDDALKVWKQNTEGITLSDQDKEIECMLNFLCKQ